MCKSCSLAKKAHCKQTTIVITHCCVTGPRAQQSHNFIVPNILLNIENYVTHKYDSVLKMLPNGNYSENISLQF